MEMVEKVTDIIKEKTESEDVVVRRITLEGINSPEARTFFFIQLIEGLEGYKLENVKQVDIRHPKAGQPLDESEEDDSSEISGYIKNAVLNGEGVHISKQFKQFHDQGYHITKITWTVIDETPGGNKVELLAFFQDTLRCTDFKYQVKSIYKSKDGAFEFNLTGRSPSNEEKKVLTKLLEDASQAASDKVIEEYGVSETNEDE